MKISIYDLRKKKMIDFNRQLPLYFCYNVFIFHRNKILVCNILH